MFSGIPTFQSAKDIQRFLPVIAAANLFGHEIPANLWPALINPTAVILLKMYTWYSGGFAIRHAVYG